MIEAKNPADFQQLTLSIQEQLRKDNSLSANSFNCFHPKWFGISDDLLVDDTICRFCGYKLSCEKFQVINHDSVEIFQLDDSSYPEKSIVESCFDGFDINGNPERTDPFMGFSSQAGNARKLFLISVANFNKFSKNNSHYKKIEPAIGYDSKFGQPIWIFDQILLNEIHKKNVLKKIQKSLSSGNFKGLKQLLFQSDEHRLRLIAIELGWCTQDSSEEDFEALKLILNRIAHVLLETSTSLKNLVIQPFLPYIDHPPNHGCSGTLNLVIRFLQFHSNILSYYSSSPMRLNDILFESQDRLVKSMISDISFVFDSLKSDDKIFRYFPRFPMIAFVPNDKMDGLELDFASGRIIDVVGSKTFEPLLLIDGLGHNLELHGPWSKC